MKLYRVTTTFIGADKPSNLYFNTEEKAKTFVMAECQNGEIKPVDVVADYPLNYADGCTINDLTFGDFNAKESELHNGGWVKTRSLGDVVVNEYGNVVRTVRNGLAVYPYRWSAKLNCWNECSGEYKPAYLAKLIRDDKAIWS